MKNFLKGFSVVSEKEMLEINGGDPGSGGSMSASPNIDNGGWWSNDYDDDDIGGGGSKTKNCNC